MNKTKFLLIILMIMSFVSKGWATDVSVLGSLGTNQYYNIGTGTTFTTSYSSSDWFMLGFTVNNETYYVYYSGDKTSTTASETKWAVTAASDLNLTSDNYWRYAFNIRNKQNDQSGGYIVGICTGTSFDTSSNWGTGRFIYINGNTLESYYNNGGTIKESTNGYISKNPNSDYYIKGASTGLSIVTNSSSATQFTIYPLTIATIPTVTCSTPATAAGTLSVDKTAATPSQTVTVTASINTGYQLKVVDGSGNAVTTTAGSNNTYTFTMPSTNVTVSLEAINYTISCSTVTGGTVSANATTATYGSTVTLSNSPSLGYTFSSYSVIYTDGDGKQQTVTVGSDGTFSMPAYNVTVYADFTDQSALYKRTVYSKTSASYPYRIPALTQNQSGKLIAIADYRPSGVDIGNGEVDLVAKTSEDAGSTWSSTATTFANGDGGTDTGSYGYGDAAVVADRESNNVLAMSCYATKGNNFFSGALQSARMTSSDGGSTWGTPTTISASSMASLVGVSGAGVFFSSGKILQSQYTKVGSYYRIYAALCATQSATSNTSESTKCYKTSTWVVYSDDFGANWSVLGGTSAAPVVNGNEAKVEELPDGRIVVSSRVNDNAGATSGNAGRYFNIFTYTNTADAEGSWGTAVKNTTISASDNNGTNGEILIVPAKDASNNDVYVALQSAPAGGTEGNRSHVSVYYKVLDAYTNFKDVSTFATGWTLSKELSSTTSAYSTMILQQDGNIGLLYEENSYNGGYDIIYNKFALSELASGYTLNTSIDRKTFVTNYFTAYEATQTSWGSDVKAEYEGLVGALADGITTAELDAIYSFIANPVVNYDGKTVTLTFKGYTSSAKTTSYNRYVYNADGTLTAVSSKPSGTTDSQYQFIMKAGSNGGYTFQSVSDDTKYIGLSSNTICLTTSANAVEFILTKSNKRSGCGYTAETMDGYALQYNISTGDDGYRFAAVNSSNTLNFLDYTTQYCTNVPDYTTDIIFEIVETGYKVTCSTATNGSFSASPNTNVASGATVTLTATPATGYELGSYTVKNADGDDISTTVGLSGDTFTMPDYDVTVSATFTLSSTISDPNHRPWALKTSNGLYLDMSTGTLSSTIYPYNFTAGDNTGDWSITQTGTGSILAPTESGSVAFGSDAYTWTIAGSNDACTIATADGTYLGAASTTSGASITSNNTTATQFTLVPLYIVWPKTCENGSVAVDYSKCFQSVAEGEKVYLTNTPASGYVLQSYTVTFTDGNNVQQSFVVGSEGTFEMPAYDVNVTATFVTAYTVSVSEEISDGSVTATPTSAYEGQTITLTNTPASGYAFSGYTVVATDDATKSVTVTDGKFTMPAYDVIVSARFVAAAYTITCNTTTGGTVTANTTGANENETITLTVTPNTNYALSALTVNGSDVTSSVSDGTYSFSMPASNVTVSATFTQTSSRIFALKTDITIQTGRKYLLVYQSAGASTGQLMSSSFTSNTYNSHLGAPLNTDLGEVNITNNTITTDVANAFSILNGSETGKYYILNNAGYYFGNTSSQTWFSVVDSKNSSTGLDNTISLSATNAGFATIKGDISYTSDGVGSLGYNTGTSAFFYGGGAQPYIYEEVVGYIITDATVSGGYITADYTSADDGTEVTLTVHPNGGYELKALTVDGTTVYPKGSSDGTYTYTFAMPSHNVTVSSTYNGLYDGAAVVLKCIGNDLSTDPSTSFSYYLTTSSSNTLATTSTSGTTSSYLFKVTTKDGGYVFQSVSNPSYCLTVSNNNICLAEISVDNATPLQFVKTGKASGNNVEPMTMTGYALQYTCTGYDDDGIRFAAISENGAIDHINYTSEQWTKDNSTYWSSDFTMIIKYRLTWDQKNVHAYSIDLSESGTGAIDLTDADIAGAYEFLGSVKNANSLVYVEDDHDFSSTTYPNNIVVNTDGNGTYTCSSLVLTDKVDVSIPYAFTAAKTTYTRDNTDKYGVLFFPYAPIKKEGYAYLQLTAKNLDLANQTGTLTFTEIEGDPQPNTPYLYRNTTGEKFDLSTTDASVVVAAHEYPTPNVYTVASNIEGWSIVNTYEKTYVFAEENGGDYSSVYSSITNNKVVDPNSYYVKGAISKFAKVNGYFSSSSFRSYFSVASGYEAKGFTFSLVVDDTTPTNIIDVEDNGDGTVNVIYDLSGRKHNEAQKGQVNIINGKKVFVK